jgi:thiol-disulfide isomerase/thioredoxin
MKSRLLFCILFCFVSAESIAQTTRNEGDTSYTSPEFKFVTLAGESVASQDLKRKVVVLDFWNSTCNPCKKSMPQMEKFYQNYKSDPRVAVYLVNSGWETIDKAKDFADTKRSGFLFFSSGKKYDLPFAYDEGSATMKAFEFNSNPATIIIDAGFKIRIRHSGFIENFFEFLTKHVEQYLAEK